MLPVDRSAVPLMMTVSFVSLFRVCDLLVSFVKQEAGDHEPRPAAPEPCTICRTSYRSGPCVTIAEARSWMVCSLPWTSGALP